MIMENKYNIKCIKFSNQEELDKAEELANKEGYFVAMGRKLSFEYLKEYYESCGSESPIEYILYCFYDNTDNSKQYCYTSISK